MHHRLKLNSSLRVKLSYLPIWFPVLVLLNSDMNTQAALTRFPQGKVLRIREIIPTFSDAPRFELAVWPETIS